MTNTDKTYNGWTNYATWRVNLEIFDGQSPEDITGEADWTDKEYELGEALKDAAEEAISGYGTVKEGLALDYALAFLSDVNWQEIAAHLIADYPVEQDA